MPGQTKNNETAASVLLLFSLLSKHLLRLGDEALAVLDLSLPQFETMRILWQGDRLTLGEISRVCCCAPPNVTGLVDRLEDKGFVERRPDPEDRRALRVCLTEAGRGLAAPAMRAMQRLLDQLAEALSEEEIAELCRLQCKLYEHLAGEGACCSVVRETAWPSPPGNCEC